LKISRVVIKNYRNIENIDIHLSDTVTLIGENNSGKSNFLRAITLPFFTDETSLSGKNLAWTDINNNAKEKYYRYVVDNQEKIKNDIISCEDFISNMPVITVDVYLEPNETENFFVKELCWDIVNGEMVYGLRYEYKPAKIDEIFATVKNVLNKENMEVSKIGSVKMNLLPVENYSYSISVPGKGSVPYDVLKRYKYISLEAERDEFSRSRERIGSKSLVKLLKKGLTDDDKMSIEKEYYHFFETIKNISKMDSILNWQEDTELKDAKEFFSHINVLPNMPPMHSLLNSVHLGYREEEMSTQGLGYRNMILLLVLINSLVEKQNDVALNVLAIEEPEAHLCINNIKLMTSFLNAFTKNNKSVQLFYSTHNTEFVNKLALKNVVVMHDGKAFSFIDELDEKDMDYLTKNPNLDLFKLFFSKKCVLFEGISEEMLIRSYIDSKKELSDIEMLSFHKGFTNIIEIWKKVNFGTGNKLGIIRDYDAQENAKNEHDRLDDGMYVCVRTTKEYTLEPDIVNTGNNYEVLKKKYGETFGWSDFSKEQMQSAWRDAKATQMLTICKDIVSGELNELQMPQHIQEVLNFMNSDSV
jgi:predicted ATP-dependent endonuclease of OLD family